jgi:hypothetical protein
MCSFKMPTEDFAESTPRIVAWKVARAFAVHDGWYIQIRMSHPPAVLPKVQGPDVHMRSSVDVTVSDVRLIPKFQRLCRALMQGLQAAHKPAEEVVMHVGNWPVDAARNLRLIGDRTRQESAVEQRLD